MTRATLPGLLDQAKAELGCERCYNRGWVTIRGEKDECPECHGDLRHPRTIELLETIVAQLAEARP